MAVLPSGYTILEWIQSTGTQHINTGYKVNKNTILDFKLRTMNANPQTKDNFLFGSGNNASLQSSRAYGATRLVMGAGQYSVSPIISINNLLPNSTIIGHVENGNSSLNYDGTVITSTDAYGTTFPSASLLLFMVSSSGFGYMKLYSFIIKENGIYIHNYIPVKSPSNEIGLYDLVDGVFHGNDGTGEFVAGPVVYKQQLFIGSFISKVFINDEINKIYIGNSLIWENPPIFVDVPAITSNLTYNGNPQSLTIGSYDHNVIQATYSSQTNAGSYNVVFHLIDPTRYQWSDGTTEDKSVDWSIAKLSLTIPSVSGGGTFKGSSYTATVSDYNSTYESQSGDSLTQTNAGTYTVKWNLKDTTNTQWSGGTTGEKSGSWNIATKSISGATITLTGDAHTYNGNSQTQTFTLALSGFTPTYTVSGNTGTDAGTYTLTVSGTGNFSGTKTKSWSIAKALVPVPPSEVHRDYTGGVVTNGYVVPDAVEKYSGDDSATNVGRYLASYRIKSGYSNNYKWEDSTNYKSIIFYLEYVYDVYEARGMSLYYLSDTEREIENKEVYLFKTEPYKEYYEGTLWVPRSEMLKINELDIGNYYPEYKYIVFGSPYDDVIHPERLLLFNKNELFSVSGNVIKYHVQGLTGAYAATRGNWLGVTRSYNTSSSWYPENGVSSFLQYWLVRRNP